MTISKSVLELIGETPMVKAQRLDTGRCELFLKLESANPGGSIKDRIGLSMIEGAERAGKIKPGDDAGRRHRRQHRPRPGAGRAAEGLPADPRRARQDEPREDLQPQGDGRRSRADALGRRQGSSAVLPGSRRAHRATKRRARISSTSSAIRTIRARTRKPPDRKSSSRWTASVDAIVFGCGSSGTMTGLSRYFAQRRAGRRIHPRRSGRLDPRAVHQRRHAVDEIGELDGRRHRRGFPAVDHRDFSRVKKAYAISDKESFLAARELLAKEGMLGGSSTGTLLAAALKYCREQTTPKRVRRVRLRHRQQVPVEDVQRLLDARQRLPRARAPTATCAT